MQEHLLSARPRNDWRRVDPRYPWLLRTHATLGHLAAAAGATFFALASPELRTAPLLAVAAGMVCASLAFFTLVWSPRRAKRLRYLLRGRDINLEKGFLFWKQMSMSINRIQHLEVTQGPLQRLFGLATLSAYSAGTQGSDLAIPGLAVDQAHTIKTRLLEMINIEEQEPTDAG